METERRTLVLLFAVFVFALELAFVSQMSGLM